MFEKITKGITEAVIDKEYGITDVQCNGELIASTYGDVDNAEFIAYCFNLQQKYDIGMFEIAVKTLASLLEELDGCVLPSSINMEIENAENVLTKIKLTK